MYPMLRITVEVIPHGVEGDARAVAKLEAENVTKNDAGQAIAQRDDGRADYELTFVDDAGKVELVRLPNLKRDVPPWVFVREAIFALTTHREALLLARVREAEGPARAGEDLRRPDWEAVLPSS